VSPACGGSQGRKPDDERHRLRRVRNACGISQGYVSDFELCSKYGTSGVAERDRRKFRMNFTVTSLTGLTTKLRDSLTGQVTMKR